MTKQTSNEKVIAYLLTYRNGQYAVIKCTKPKLKLHFKEPNRPHGLVKRSDLDY